MTSADPKHADPFTFVTMPPWAARYSTWLLIKLTLKGVVFSFLFFVTIPTEAITLLS